MKKKMRLALLTLMCCTVIHVNCQKQDASDDIARGWISETDLKDYFDTWDAEASDYEVNTPFVQKLDSLHSSFTIQVFLGTWCPDCEKELPRLMKVIGSLRKTKFNVYFYGLDRKQADKSGMREKFNISYVPTLIIYQDDQEIGRIIETPEFTLEEDLFLICSRTR